MEAELDLGVAPPEAADARRQPADGEGGPERDSQGAAAVGRAQPFDGGGDAPEGVAEHGMERRAVLGQGQPARQAVEQAHAKVALQRLHLVADRRLGDAELDGGAGEAQVPRRGLESAQGDGRWQG